MSIFLAILVLSALVLIGIIGYKVANLEKTLTRQIERLDVYEKNLEDCDSYTADLSDKIGTLEYITSNVLKKSNIS